MNNPSTTPVPEAPEPKAWAFHYDGPIQPADDRNCELCNAAAMKKCGKLGDIVRHGAETPQSGPEPWLKHCSSCHAARMGYCYLHCGVDTALQKHTVSVTGAGHVIHSEQAEGWSAAQAHIMTLAAGKAAKGVKTIRVRAHADQDQPEMPFARVVVSVTALK